MRGSMGRKSRNVAILGPRPDGIPTSWEELGSWGFVTEPGLDDDLGDLPQQPVASADDFSPWGRSRSIHGRLLTASVKICDPRGVRSRESRSALEASATLDEVHLRCFIAQMNPASRHGRRGWGGGRAQRNRRKRRAHPAAFTAYRRPSAGCPLRRPCPATRRPSDRRSPGNPTSDPRRVR